MSHTYRATVEGDRIRWHQGVQPDFREQPFEVQVVVLDDAAAEPLITQTPGACGGDACFGKYRIPVWLVVEAWQLGWTDHEILSAHPVLTPEHLAAARVYYDERRQEIDRRIGENAAA